MFRLLTCALGMAGILATAATARADEPAEEKKAPRVVESKEIVESKKVDEKKAEQTTHVTIVATDHGRVQLPTVHGQLIRKEGQDGKTVWHVARTDGSTVLVTDKDGKTTWRVTNKDGTPYVNTREGGVVTVAPIVKDGRIVALHTELVAEDEDVEELAEEIIAEEPILEDEVITDEEITDEEIEDHNETENEEVVKVIVDSFGDGDMKLDRKSMKKLIEGLKKETATIRRAHDKKKAKADGKSDKQMVLRTIQRVLDGLGDVPLEEILETIGDDDFLKDIQVEVKGLGGKPFERFARGGKSMRGFDFRSRESGNARGLQKRVEQLEQQNKRMKHELELMRRRMNEMMGGKAHASHGVNVARAPRAVLRALGGPRSHDGGNIDTRLGRIEAMLRALLEKSGADAPRAARRRAMIESDRSARRAMGAARAAAMKAEAATRAAKRTDMARRKSKKVKSPEQIQKLLEHSRKRIEELRRRLDELKHAEK